MSQFPDPRFGVPVAVTLEWQPDAVLDDEERATIGSIATHCEGAAVAEPPPRGVGPLLIIAIVLVGVVSAAAMAKVVSFVACRLKSGCTVDLRSTPPRVRKEQHLPGGMVILIAKDGSHTTHSCGEELEGVIRAGFEVAGRTGAL
jgi:hypothetical protein